MQAGYDPIDVHVGSRVRAERLRLGLTQRELATRVGVTYQQVQKYESGRNRAPASMLLKLSEALGTPVEGFFPTSTRAARAASPPMETVKHGAELARLFGRLSQTDRLMLVQFARRLAEDTED